MRIRTVFMAAAMTCLACIGWSGEQQEVVNSYNAVRDHISDGNWDDLLSSFDEETGDLLEALTALYTQSGAPFDNDAEAFLEALAMETGILRFPERILSVEITGSRAVLTAEESGEVLSFRFNREAGRWKLGFGPVIRGMFQDMMDGLPGVSSASSGTPAIPSLISVGDGPCAVLVRNGLSGLAIHQVYCTLSTDEEWGDDLLGQSILGTGSELQIKVEPGVYDILALDSQETAYSVWQAEVTPQGVLWVVTEADIDQN